MVVQRNKLRGHRIVSFWGALGASFFRCPPILLSFVIVFGWGIVVGRVSSYKPSSKVEMMYERQHQRVIEMLQASKETTEQIAVIAMLFVVSCASTLSLAIRDGDRRSRLRLFGLGSTSGFLVVGLYCVGVDYVARLGLISPNLFWIGVASFVGFTAPYQDRIGAKLFEFATTKALGAAIITLQSIQGLSKPKDDNSKKDEKQ